MITFDIHDDGTCSIDFGGHTFRDVLSVCGTALQFAMRQVVEAAQAQSVPEESIASLKAELYDSVNITFSTILMEFAPEIEMHPNLTAEAILKAENDILDS